MNNNLIVFFNDSQHTVVHAYQKESLPKSLKLAAETLNKTVNEIVYHTTLTTEELNNMYRPALIFKNGKIYTDREKVIEDKLIYIRKIRNQILSELDIPRKVAEETGDKEKYNLLTEKVKKLRDITKNIDWDKFKTDKEILEYNPFENI